jgi:signal recognition particle GTPase
MVQGFDSGWMDSAFANKLFLSLMEVYTDSDVIRALFKYLIKTDARVMALQSVLSEIGSKSTDHSKDEISYLVEARHNAIYQAMLEKAEDEDSLLAALMLGEFLPETDI